MPLSNYSELQASVAAWLDNTTLTAVIPDCIRLAEAEFDRVLRMPEMEALATATLTAGNERIAVPTDFAGVKSVTLLTNPTLKLTGVTSAVLQDLFGGGAYSGRPTHYAVSDGQFWLGPVPDGAYTLSIVYWQRIPKLSDSTTTNWLLTAYPDLYLMATLLQAEFHGWNDERLPLVRSRVEAIIAQMTQDGLGRATPAQARLAHGVRGG